MGQESSHLSFKASPTRAITHTWGCPSIGGGGSWVGEAGFSPLSDIRASLSPMVTFRAGNYPTQCPSTLKFNIEIKCVVKGPVKAFNFLSRLRLRADWSVPGTKALSIMCFAEYNT